MAPGPTLAVDPRLGRRCITRSRKPLPGFKGLANLGSLNPVTQILERLARNEPAASAELLPLVYDELRRLAAFRMAQDAPGQTLQPTALVHEAYLRLVDVAKPQVWDGRGHFFAAAAEAMRRILVENARRKKRLKRGGDLDRVSLEGLDIAATADDEQVLAVSESLDRLAAHDPEAADLIKLRFFVGLSNVEAAGLMKIPERTAKRRWAYARAWLLEDLRSR